MIGPLTGIRILLVLAIVFLTTGGFNPLAPPALAQSTRFDALHRMIPINYDSTRSLALGDVDGDDDLDVFVGSWSFYGTRNRLLINDGRSFFSDATLQVPDQDINTESVVLGDLDGDGDLDAFCGNGYHGNGDEQNRLFLNDGTGLFVDATWRIPVDYDCTQSVALGDVDGDGDLDLFLGNGDLSGYQNRLYINDGSAFFTDATSQIPAISDETYAVALADVDGDGDLDAFIGNDGQNRLYINDGSGVYSDATAWLPVMGDQTFSIDLEDLDGDGDVDAFIGNYGKNRLYINDGTGFFDDATPYQTPDDGTVSVVAGDVDGDGDIDLFAGNHLEQSSLYLNDGAGGFSIASSNLPAHSDEVQDVALGDLDGDGDLDILIGNGHYDDWHDRIYLNDGTGVFTDVTAHHQGEGGNNYFNAALGDVDGDQDLDLFVGDPDSNKLYLNDGTGHFSDASFQIPAYPDYTMSVALGDVDNDGDLDAFIGNLNGEQNRLYINDGTGDFSDATSQLPVDADYTECVILADVDGDGDLDAFIGNGYLWWEANRFYVNDGTGRFTDESYRIPANSETTNNAVFGDVDGDGDLDALIANGDSAGEERNCLWINDGTGVYSDATSQIPHDNDYCYSVDLGDVDDDGDLDALLGNGNQNRLYVNDGSGYFSDATSQLPVEDEFTCSVALRDLDGDGDLDAFVGNWDDGSRLYINDGTGIFTNAVEQMPVNEYPTGAVVLGDLDGDSDLDAMIGYCAPEVIYSNLTRHLSWRGVPRVGKPLNLEVRGPAAGWYLLVASPQRTYLPYPPFGILRVLYSAAIYQNWGVLDNDGRAIETFQVPPWPNLVGLTLYGQALVGPPARLTNLEVTAFTDL